MNNDYNNNNNYDDNSYNSNNYYSNNDYYSNNSYSNPAPTNSTPTSVHPLSKVSKILGIVGLVTAFCNGPTISIAALILACISKSKVGYFEPQAQSGKSLGIAGIILGSVGIVVMFILEFILILAEEMIYYL